MSTNAERPSPKGGEMYLKKHVELLGHRAVDKITGFKGVIDSISFDLYGCIQACVRPAIDKK